MRKTLVSAAVTLVLLSAIVVGRALESPGQRMTQAAAQLLAALSDSQRAQATFAFDDAERLNWHFIPRDRKGVPLRALSDAQKAAVRRLLEAGTSKSGYRKALDVMALEAILRDIEGTERARQIRDPNLYFVSVFGKPDAEGLWGWRIEGHHFCVNYAIKDGQVVSATPVFYGANPAKVPQGRDKAGFRALPEEEDVARQLYLSLEPALRRVATIGERAPDDILTGAQNAKPKATAVQGVKRAELNDTQRETLDRLIQLYADRLPAEVSAELIREAKESGLDATRFAWAGPAEPGSGHYYRIQGPTFVIEYCNTQNNANHIHSVLRRAAGDFGVSGNGS